MTLALLVPGQKAPLPSLFPSPVRGPISAPLEPRPLPGGPPLPSPPLLASFLARPSHSTPTPHPVSTDPEFPLKCPFSLFLSCRMFPPSQTHLLSQQLMHPGSLSWASLRHTRPISTFSMRCPPQPLRSSRASEGRWGCGGRPWSVASRLPIHCPFHVVGAGGLQNISLGGEMQLRPYVLCHVWDPGSQTRSRRRGIDRRGCKGEARSAVPWVPFPARGTGGTGRNPAAP